MLACYDGQGAFYKPHMDSATTDPRRVTAIVYLVADDWDAAPDRDGGQLVWWNILEGDPDNPKDSPKKHVLNPTTGQLCVFKARTIMHEVLPTHRKRFAVTLWYYLKPGSKEAIQSAKDHETSLPKGTTAA